MDDMNPGMEEKKDDMPMPAEGGDQAATEAPAGGEMPAEAPKDEDKKW